MPTTLTVNPITAKVSWDYQSTNNFGTNSIQNASFTYSKSTTNGTGAGKAQKLHVDTLTIAGGATTTLDLDGVLTDVFGTAISFDRIKVIYIELTTTTTSTSITVGGHATQAFRNWITGAPDMDTAQPKIRVRNGGCFFLACTDATGYDVTNTTQDKLNITNEDGSNAATVNICLIGE